MDAIELFNKDGKSIDMWICGKCRRVTLNPLYSFDGRGPQNTRESAELCCVDPTCTTCGNTFKARMYSAIPECDSCRDKKSNQRDAERLEKRLSEATEVRDVSSMIFCEGVGDEWFDSMDELVEWIEENHFDYESGNPYPRPEWAFATIGRARTLDLYSAIDSELERLCEDGYEDMEIVIDKPLRNAVERFNKRHKSALTVYRVDYSRKIRVPSPSTEF